MKTFSVTLNFNCNYGYIVYDLKNKTASVKLAAQDAKEKIEEYLKSNPKKPFMSCEYMHSQRSPSGWTVVESDTS